MASKRSKQYRKRTRYSEALIRQVCHRLAMGESYTTIAHVFGIDEKSVYRIATGRQWTKVTGMIPSPHKRFRRRLANEVERFYLKAAGEQPPTNPRMLVDEIRTVMGFVKERVDYLSQLAEAEADEQRQQDGIREWLCGCLQQMD